MNRLLLLFLSMCILSCEKEAEVDYAILSGTILNPAGEKVVIYKGQDQVAEIELNDQGKFVDTLKNVASGYFTLSHGRENTSMYLEPGYIIDLSLNTEEFDESIKYEGESAAASNYLAAKYLKNEELAENPSEIYTMEEVDFKAKLEDIKNAFTNLLQGTENIDEDFKRLETKNINYEYLVSLQNYPTFHEYYAKKPKFEPTEGFLAPLAKLDFGNDEDYEKIANYKRLVLNHYSRLIRESDDPAKAFQEINQVASPAVKADLAKNLAYEINPNNENNKIYHDGIMAMSSDQEFKDNIKLKYEKVQALTKGNPSPVFTDYENHKGGTTSLADLKGKYVYVDVWATWCGPCKVEIPYLQEVEKKYHGKNIAFVSTSIDRAADHGAWVDMVNDKELGGIQLMADNDWNSKFVTDYAIEGIPRFILIDPDGNIVTADAPRPSNPELTEMFEALKI